MSFAALYIHVYMLNRMVKIKLQTLKVTEPHFTELF